MANLTIRIDLSCGELMRRLAAMADAMGIRPTTAARILIKEALDARDRHHV